MRVDYEFLGSTTIKILVAGSPVTYNPGIPREPPARVISIIEFSSVAGCSTLAALPCPRASKPTQSMAESTRGSPVIWAICSARDASLRKSTVSQPKLLACVRRSGIISPTMTTAAPNEWQDAAQARPTGPARATYTIDRGYARLNRSVITSGKDIGQKREVLDLRHIEITVGRSHLRRRRHDGILKGPSTARPSVS